MNWILTKLGLVKSDLGRILSTFETALSNLEQHIAAKAKEAGKHAEAEVDARMKRIAASDEAAKATAIAGKFRDLLVR
jgi:hypothetical protein